MNVKRKKNKTLPLLSQLLHSHTHIHASHMSAYVMYGHAKVEVFSNFTTYFGAKFRYFIIQQSSLCQNGDSNFLKLLYEKKLFRQQVKYYCTRFTK